MTTDDTDGWPFFCRIGTSTLRSTEKNLREETFQQPFLVAGLLVSVKGGTGRIRAGKKQFSEGPDLGYLF